MRRNTGARRTIAIVAAVTSNFWSFARVLADSIRAHHPDMPLFIVLVDPLPDGVAPDDRYVTVPCEALGMPGLTDRRFTATGREMTILAKPYALRWLLDRGYETAVFLDADMLVTGPLDPLLSTSAAHALTLTPHLLAPLDGEDRVDRELNILLSGAYNGGAMGVSARGDARRFLEWWAERVLGCCRLDPARGMHDDQRWLDLAPSYFDDVAVVRDPGCNVAYWNLPERQVRIENGRVMAGGAPCRLFHFSGFDPLRPDLVSRHSDGATRQSIGAAGALFDDYAARMLAAGHAVTRTWSYRFDRFDNGVRIPAVARALYRDTPAASDRFGDPFRTQGPGSFHTWLSEPDARLAGPHEVSRLWAAIHASRPDLQRAFPAPAGVDRDGFARWAVTSGLVEHDVDAALAPRVG